jgi:MFS transporter, putative metabolite:H+ symporter
VVSRPRADQTPGVHGGGEPDSPPGSTLESGRELPPDYEEGPGGGPAQPRPAAYLRLLLALLLPAALFNSYDGELRAVLLTQLKSTFHVGTAAIGVANIPIGAGQFVAFFVVLSADRIGRRPILMWSILGYTVCTTLSATSWDLWSFAAFQFGAQVFIGAEFGVAVTLLAEEVPAEHRGRFLSWLLLVSPLGAVLAGLLVAVGFLHNPIGWRAFFLLAAVPLLVVSVARRRLQESEAFSRVKETRGPPPARTARRAVVGSVAVFRGSARPRVLAVGGIAFLQGLASAAAVGWWTYYAEHERHFGTGTAGAFFAAAALVSVLGYLSCGRMMDRIGRRPTAVVYALAAVGCAVTTFQVSDRWVMLPFLVGTAFFGIGIAPALSAFATELFPTMVRAQASAWIRNGFGNTGSVLGPALVGILGASAAPLHSIGMAVTVLVAALVLAVPVIVWVIPETRAARLDEAPVEPPGGSGP